MGSLHTLTTPTKLHRLPSPIRRSNWPKGNRTNLLRGPKGQFEIPKSRPYAARVPENEPEPTLKDKQQIDSEQVTRSIRFAKGESIGESQLEAKPNRFEIFKLDPLKVCVDPALENHMAVG